MLQNCSGGGGCACVCFSPSPSFLLASVLASSCRPILLQLISQWVLSVRRDPAGRPCLDNVFSTNDASAGNGGGQNKQQLLHPVGRLDYDTTGLLLFSSSGPLTQALLHPKHEIEKEYIATVTGTVKKDELRAVLAAGVRTGEGVHTAHLLSVEYPFTDQEQVTAYLQRIKAELPAEYNATDLKARGYLDIFGGDGVDSVDSENAAPLVTALSTVTLVVSEGKHRMVRRMLANTGHPVVSLHRARLGSIRLDSSQVPEGHTRQLTAAELKWAQQQLRQGGINNTVKKNQQPTAGPMPTKKVDRLEVDDE